MQKVVVKEKRFLNVKFYTRVTTQCIHLHITYLIEKLLAARHKECGQVHTLDIVLQTGGNHRFAEKTKIKIDVKMLRSCNAMSCDLSFHF